MVILVMIVLIVVGGMATAMRICNCDYASGQVKDPGPQVDSVLRVNSEI